MLDNDKGAGDIGSNEGDDKVTGEELAILSCLILRGGPGFWPPGCWTPGGGATEKAVGLGQDKLLLA